MPSFAKRSYQWFCKRCHSILLVEYQRDDDALGLYRIAFAALCLFLLGIPRYAWIGKNPQTFFDPPPGLPRLLTGFPPDWMLHVLDWSLLLLFLALLLGWRTRATSIAITVLVLLGNSVRYSLGKIDHDILFVLTPFLFAGSWGSSFSVDALRSRETSDTGHAANSADTARRPASLGLLACLLAFGFLTAGLPKLSSWLDWDLSTQGVRSWVLRAGASDRSDLLVPFFRTLESRFVWELLDVAAVAFELGFVVALFAGPRLWNVWMGLAVLFHFGNYLMLNISFGSHLPLYLAFADWSAAARFARARGWDFPPRAPASRAWLAAAAGYVLAVIAWQWARTGGPGLLEELQLVLPLGRWRLLVLLGAAAAVTIALGVRAVLRGSAQRVSGPTRTGTEAAVATVDRTARGE